MALVRWSPFGEVQTIQDRINRMFDDFFRPDFALDSAVGTLYPPVNIVDHEKDLVLEAELPGVKKEEVQIEVHGNLLLLKGEKKESREVNEENYRLQEVRTGSFSRTFTLPNEVEAEKVKAEYKDGVLRITLPKVEAAIPRRIQITS